jgi:hypothetical protein
MPGLLDSKWAIPGVDPIRDRKARGLPGTYREEQEKVSNMKSGPLLTYFIECRASSILAQVPHIIPPGGMREK